MPPWLFISREAIFILACSMRITRPGLEGGDRMDQDDSKNCLDDHLECRSLIFQVLSGNKLWVLLDDHLRVTPG